MGARARSRDAGHDVPGPVFDPDREVQFEDVYTDTQLAVWREMHASSFAPPDVKYPEFEDEEEEITPAQQDKEARQRIEVLKVIQQLDAATLKNFRLRDEFDIRDIRRRQGLPIVSGTTMEEAYYGKTKIDGMTSFD